MSMYDMIFRVNPRLVGYLLHAAGIDEPLPRLRNAWLERHEGANPEHQVCLYTRLGGGNRSEYAGQWDEIQQHPNYLDDRDDSFDATYCEIRFRLDAERLTALNEEALRGFLGLAVLPVDHGKLWARALKR